ncbi:hypothetical protein ACKGJO_10770 [Gracilimonas sp. Q87]|uniref:hypothetical protein n=1 Tax=Gracilimonas sp. Q87 TaxID=3384766 RepID=UPI0039843436
MNVFAGTLGLILMVFLFVLGILWILVPFLIMGTNKRLDKLIRRVEDLERASKVSPNKKK